ncbi:MAG: methylaspartate mutase subunit S [Dehalococcoidales bacterium]|nr:methylaspartate mutase subunit S [Dehalococcoidales bacterium]
MEDTLNSKATLVTGVIGEDVHIVGIRILEHALRNAGYKIVALGAQTPQNEFIDAARETKADAILVSSLSGHANVLVTSFREKCIEAGLKDILLYLGGQLIIGEMAWPEVEKMYTGMGFDRVYRPDVEIPQIIQDLEADLQKRK